MPKIFFAFWSCLDRVHPVDEHHNGPQYAFLLLLIKEFTHIASRPVVSFGIAEERSPTGRPVAETFIAGVSWEVALERQESGI